MEPKTAFQLRLAGAIAIAAGAFFLAASMSQAIAGDDGIWGAWSWGLGAALLALGIALFVAASIPARAPGLPRRRGGSSPDYKTLDGWVRSIVAASVVIASIVVLLGSVGGEDFSLRASIATGLMGSVLAYYFGSKGTTAAQSVATDALARHGKLLGEVDALISTVYTGDLTQKDLKDLQMDMKKLVSQHVPGARGPGL